MIEVERIWYTRYKDDYRWRPGERASKLYKTKHNCVKQQGDDEVLVEAVLTTVSVDGKKVGE